MEKNEFTKIIRKTAMEDTNSSRELGVKFFFHWAILSGATLTLLIPFLTSQHISENIPSDLIPNIKITIISLIIALIAASLRNFILSLDMIKRANRHHKIAKALENNTALEEEKEEEGVRLLEVFQFVAISSYIFAIAQSYYFIANIIF